MNLILTVQTQNVKAKIESRETRAHRLKKKKNQLSEIGQNGAWVILLGWPLENCHEKDKNWMSSILDTVSSFCCAPGDWLAFCSITTLDVWVKEPSRTLEPGEEAEDLCSHRLFPSTDTQLLLCSPSLMASVLLGFITFLPSLVLPGFEGVVTSSQLGVKTVLLPFGSLNPVQPTKNTVQSCPTLCDPVDCSLMGSFVHGILWTRLLEWAAISSSRGSPWPRAWTQVSCKAGKFFTLWTTRETLLIPLWISPSLKSLCLPLWAYFLWNWSLWHLQLSHDKKDG